MSNFFYNFVVFIKFMSIHGLYYIDIEDKLFNLMTFNFFLKSSCDWFDLKFKFDPIQSNINWIGLG